MKTMKWKIQSRERSRAEVRQSHVSSGEQGRNPFIFQNLSLVPDYVLTESVAGYRRIHAALKSYTSRSAALIQEQLDAALDAMEKELQVRGIAVSGFNRSSSRPVSRDNLRPLY